MKKYNSLDEKELERYKPFNTPMDTPYETVMLSRQKYDLTNDSRYQTLNGEWQVAADGYTDERTDINFDWKDAFVGNVPNSIHTMLLEAGLIEDPLFAKNDKRARENSYHTWWFKKEFSYDGSLENPVLHFDGICYRGQFWLNGTYLGMHSGMFGGPDYNVSGILKEKNVLIVKLFNAPSNPYAYSQYADFDEGWKYGTVINCVYGWHYACIPSRGIWRSVHIDSTPKTITEKPFFVPVSTDGTVDLIFRMGGLKCKGKVTVNIKPKNFEGTAFGFEKEFVKELDGDSTLHYRFKIENPKLWWPNGFGEPNLYEAEVLFAPKDDIPTYCKTSFGIRTVEMAPLPDGPKEDMLNLTYVINGKPIFVKGSNWCTLDALLRFPNERYDRFLSLIKEQHIQLLRAWGGGMPESDYFYDKCDELGIMVRQEWPTCWDSDKTQPEWELADTVIRNLIRIRNHPSLVTLAGGNESDIADSPAMTRMARMSYEFDGTRVFYKTSPFGGLKPYGGIIHSYITYWDRKDIDASLNLEAPVIAEFGMASAPNLRSVQRYLPDDEKEMWPPKEKGSFYYHMPRFNECYGAIDMDFIGKRIGEFSRAETMQGWIDASQMAQATVIRHLLEKMRSRWPESVGVYYYKTTDVYPACSWATIDYYGVQKLSYYVVQDAYMPIHSALIFKSIDVHKGDKIPVYYFDDNCETVGKNIVVNVRAYNSELALIDEKAFDATGKTGFSNLIGDFEISKAASNSKPLFIVSEVLIDGELFDRTFYWLNFKDVSGCIYDVTEADVIAKVQNGKVSITNISDVPAIGVTVECPAKDEEFKISDNVIWIDAKETVSLNVNIIEGLSVKAFNMPQKDII